MSNEQFNLLEKDVLTTGEVAKICNVASRTVSKWFDSGQLKGYRIPGSKDRRIPVANLLSFMREHDIPMDGLMSGRPRVLICDTDQGVVDTLTGVLREQTNFDIRTCDSLFAAGMECERFRPHVMLYELNVSDGDGTQVCKLIHGNEDLQVTRIIAMSSRVTDGQIGQLMQCGFDSVLRKPFTVRQVIEAVESAHAVVY
jgi:excisionase family DNA binding protein